MQDVSRTSPSSCQTRQQKSSFPAREASRQKFHLTGKFCQGKFPFRTGQEIMLGKAVPIRAISKRNVQHLGISHGLLQAIRNRVIVVFSFNYGNRLVI